MPLRSALAVAGLEQIENDSDRALSESPPRCQNHTLGNHRDNWSEWQDLNLLQPLGIVDSDSDKVGFGGVVTGQTLGAILTFCGVAR